MLIIDYTNLEGNVPFIRVLGLSLVERAVLSAQAAGFDKAEIAIDEKNVTAVKTLIDAHPKIRISVSYSAALSAGNDAIVIPGDRVITGAGMKSLFERSETVETLADSFVARIVDGNIKDAENKLLRSLMKSADGIISRNINRKISLFLSRRVAKLPVHPNHVTAVVFLIGIASGFFAFFMNSYWGFFLGGLCYYVSAILDGCDGEISRLKYLGSPLGAWLDTVVDDLVGLSYILGLYGRLALDREGLWPVIGAATIAFYLITILPRYWVMARMGSGDFQKLAALKKPKEIKGFGVVVEKVRNVIFRTDFIPFYAFVTAASSFLLVFAIPFSIGAVASAVDSILDTIKVKKYLAQKG